MHFYFDEAEDRTSCSVLLQYLEPLPSARIEITHLHAAPGFRQPCREVTSGRRPLKATLQGQEYRIDWLPESGRPSSIVQLECAITADAMRFNTFSGRQVHFVNGAGDFERELKPVSWIFAFDMPGVENVNLEAVAENFEYPGPQLRRLLDWRSPQLVAPGERLVLSWRSQNRESLRDIIIVIIGSLVALGAAMLLEALRPFVERIAGR